MIFELHTDTPPHHSGQHEFWIQGDDRVAYSTKFMMAPHVAEELRRQLEAGADGYEDRWTRIADQAYREWQDDKDSDD